MSYTPISGDVIKNKTLNTRWLCVINTPEYNKFVCVSRGADYPLGFASESHNRNKVYELEPNWELVEHNRTLLVLYG
jgi:hypothetical protein